MPRSYANVWPDKGGGGDRGLRGLLLRELARMGGCASGEEACERVLVGEGNA